MSRKYAYTAATIGSGKTAKEIIAHVEDGDISSAQAAKYLHDRMAAQVANGRRPRYASLKAYATLAGKEFEFDRSATPTRKQRRKAAAETAAPAKAAKPKRTRKSRTNAKPEVSVDELVAQLGSALEGADQATIMAAFTKLLHK